MSNRANPCAGPFGAVYDFYVERERLSQAVGALAWGIDVRPMYRSMDALAGLADGARVLDAPCGGGVALRGLRPGQDVRYIGVDLDERMLARFRRRAARSGLATFQAVQADMAALPLPGESVDLCLTFSGLHAVDDPRGVLRELLRCLRVGGRLVGSTFTTEGTRRQRWFFASAERRGVPVPRAGRDELEGWLREAGVVELALQGSGFVVFSGIKERPETSATGPA